jgi:hypothetical protein
MEPPQSFRRYENNYGKLIQRTQTPAGARAAFRRSRSRSTSFHLTTAAWRANARNRFDPNFNTPRARAKRAPSVSQIVEARFRRRFTSVGIGRLALRRSSRTSPSATSKSLHPNTVNGPKLTGPIALSCASNFAE